MNLQEKVETLYKRYEASKRTDAYEPKYTLHPFDEIYAYLGKLPEKSGMFKFMKKPPMQGVAALRHHYDASEEDSDADMLKQFEENTLDSLLIPDGFVASGGGFFPDRVIHDGFKVGTTSWIFMGRKNSPVVPIKYHGHTLYATNRTIPDEIARKLKTTHPELGFTMWCAYDLDGKYGVEIGPCFSLDQIQQAADTGGHFTVRPVNID